MDDGMQVVLISLVRLTPAHQLDNVPLPNSPSPPSILFLKLKIYYFNLMDEKYKVEEH